MIRVILIVILGTLQGVSFAADVLQEKRDEEQVVIKKEQSLNDRLDGLGDSNDSLEKEIEAIKKNQQILKDEIAALQKEIEEFKTNNPNADFGQISELYKKINEKRQEYSEIINRKNEIFSDLSALQRSINGLIGSYCFYERREKYQFSQIDTIINMQREKIIRYDLAELDGNTIQMESLRDAIYAKHKAIIDAGKPTVALSCSNRITAQYLPSRQLSSNNGEINDMLEYKVVETYDLAAALVEDMKSRREQLIILLMAIID
ncbi:MAG: hypothetical protein AB8G05_24975 [Oligoflexales bacterium]